jgi:hypothetical protein
LYRIWVKVNRVRRGIRALLAKTAEMVETALLVRAAVTAYLAPLELLALKVIPALTDRQAPPAQEVLLDLKGPLAHRGLLAQWVAWVLVVLQVLRVVLDRLDQ